MGNGEAKELRCMTQGHELRWGNAGGRGVAGQRRIKEKVQGIRSINGRHKIERRRLRIVWEMEKPKNLCVQPWT